MVPLLLLCCTTAPHNEQLHLQDVTLTLCSPVFIQGSHITTVQHKQLQA